METTRYYARYVSETEKQVVLVEHAKCITLDRCRMYNSHLAGGYLYTEYADKEYKPTEKLDDKQIKLRSRRSEPINRKHE